MYVRCAVCTLYAGVVLYAFTVVLDCSDHMMKCPQISNESICVAGKCWFSKLWIDLNNMDALYIAAQTFF